MSITSILIIAACAGAALYALYSYTSIFITQWKRNETFRPDGNDLAKLEQKEINLHGFKMKEGFHGEDETRNS